MKHHSQPSLIVPQRCSAWDQRMLVLKSEVKVNHLLLHQGSRWFADPVRRLREQCLTEQCWVVRA